MKTEAQTIRSELVKKMGNLPEYTLALSGGIDSSVLLYSALEAGNPPKECVTFALDASKNDDLQAAATLCSIYKIPLIVANISTKTSDIIRDTKEVISVIGKPWKVHVHSCWPYKYIMPCVTTKNIVAGTRADYYYPLKKATNIARMQMTEADFDVFYVDHRKQKWNNRNQSFDSMRTYINSISNVAFVEPYNDDVLFDLALSLTFRDWNMHGDKVKHKYLWFKLFQNYFEESGIYRKQSPMQIVTGIKEAHLKLLQDPSVNTRGNKDLLGVYNNMLKESQQNTLI
jgi:hypothetical protein